MSEEPRLYLEPSLWPGWLKALGILVLIGFGYGLFFVPSPLYQPIIFLIVFGQGLERFWKKQRVGIFSRMDDPHIFWFIVGTIGALVIFSLWLLVEAIGRMI